MSTRILVVDDEWNMRNLIKIYLTNEKFQIDEARDGPEAIGLVCTKPYDLMILDVMMPEIDGWQVCKTIREFKDMPILMLTARNDIKDKVYGLNLGADDYLVKPFAPEELVARVKALLRRKKFNDDIENDTLEFHQLSLNFDSREVRVNRDRVDLTPKEFNLLFTVASQPKRVFTREMLLEQIWANHDDRDLRTVDTHIKNIREKLKNANLGYNPIKTIWGVGYKFQMWNHETE